MGCKSIGHFDSTNGNDRNQDDNPNVSLREIIQINEGWKKPQIKQDRLLVSQRNEKAA